MASRGGPAKRKWSQGEQADGGYRTSPHRPGDLPLAQQHGPHSPTYSDRGYRGRGRGQRGGRGGRGGRGSYHNSPHNSPNGASFQQRTPTTPSQPAAPQQQQPPQHNQSQSNQPEHAPKLAERTKPEPIAVTKATQTPPPPSPVAPYSYTHLTDDIIQNWAETGRESVLRVGQDAVKSKDNVLLGVLFQEIIRSTLDRRLDPTQMGTFVKDTLAVESEEADSISINSASLFLDNVAIGDYRDSELPYLKSMLTASEIPAQRMRTEFDVDFLIKVGLVRETFNQMRARHQTNVLYRQSNYNLLREETEGYSKLVTELFTSSGGEPPNPPEVLRTYERVRSMIGTFDLDIGRVLDIHLDVFAAVLVRYYRYFVKYLRISSWWPEQLHLDDLRGSELSFKCLPTWALPDRNGYDSPSEEERHNLVEAKATRDVLFWDRARAVGTKAFFELAGSSIDVEQVEELIPGEGTEIKERRAWAKATGLMPPPGNRVAAQILGFKLRFYSSDARASTDLLPANLIHLAALLIKIGFISLADLYPHLWPYDEDMEKVKEQKMQEKQEREMSRRPGGGRLNALAAAGSLGDEPGAAPISTRAREAESKATAKTDSKAEDTKMDVEDSQPELPEPADQKVQLLKSLLCIGALPEGLYMIGRYPWLLDAYPELSELIHRILGHCIRKLYEDARSIGDFHEIRDQEQSPDLDQSGVAKGSVRLFEHSPPKVLRWPQPDKYDPDSAVDYKFYWEDWNDNVPVCQTVDDFFTLTNTFMNLSGFKIGQDSALLTGIARIGRHSLASDDSDANKKRWMDLSKRLILPALSFTKNNSGAIAEVWDLIKNFPLSTRYNMYAEWFTGQTSRLEDMRLAFDLTRAETKDVLKRISKTNMKSMARALSKISTSSPGIVFSVALTQIESYENLIEVIVECARYFTFLSYDILIWTLMSSLGASGRNRVQADGMLRSKWLNALATFSGKVFKRYSVMNPSPILQYVTSQLGKGNTTDLIVLEELIGSMAGIVSDATFNDAQVVAMGGGPLLQSQVMLQLLDRRHEAIMKPTSRRLMKSLIEPKLIAPLLVSMAQEWQTCIYRVPDEQANLKVLANLFDETHRILVQYLDLLRSNLTTSEFHAYVPSFRELVGAYGLEPQIVFWISRPSIAADMADFDKRLADEKKEQAQSQPDPDAKAEAEVKDADMTDASEPKESTPMEASKDEADTEMKDGLPTSGQDVAEQDNPWHPVLKSLVDNTATLLPEGTWAVLNQHFYFTFWQLSLEDIGVPMSSYEDEINRLKRKVMAVNSDRSDLSSRGKEKKDEEKKALTDLQSRLRAETGIKIAAYQRTKQRINKEKDLWFADRQGMWDDLNVAILEHCFIPRIKLSSVDALYTFKILKHLHTVGTVNFRTVGLLDQFFNSKRLSALIYVCTSREAENLGKFINELIKELARWHADKTIYEKEAYGARKDLPGFKVKTSGKGTSELLEYESFRTLLGKWHTNLHVALKTSLSGEEYMHIRNAINILKSISASFPVINWMGQQELNIVSDLGKSEKREDLKLSAMSLLGSLKRREKSWVMPQAFMVSTMKPAANQGRATSRGISPAVANDSKSDTTMSEPTKSDAKVSSSEPLAEKKDSETTSTGTETNEVGGVSKSKESPAADTKDSSADIVKPTADPAKTRDGKSVPPVRMPPPAAPEKQAPNGASAVRPVPKTNSSHSRPGSAPESAPPTPPSDSSDSGGVHPDRLRAMSGLPPRSGAAAPTPPTNTRAAQQSNQPPNPATRAGGPAAYNYNDRRSDKRFAAVNTILQQPPNQANAPDRGQGANIRGQASRPNSLPQAPPAFNPPSRYGQSNPSNSLPPRPEPQAPRKELFTNHNASGPGFREDARHIDRDGERRGPRSRDTRSASPHRPPGFDAHHNQAGRDEGSGRALRSREEPPPSRPRDDMRDSKGGRPPPIAPERDARRPHPREDLSGGYPSGPRDTRRGPPGREEHLNNGDIRDRDQRHPAPRSGQLPPEREEPRSLRSRGNEPPTAPTQPRRNDQDSRDLRQRPGQGPPPPLAPERDRDSRRGGGPQPPTSRDDQQHHNAERDRFAHPPRSAPPTREEHPPDAHDRERYPPSANPRSGGGAGPALDRDDGSGGGGGGGRNLRHRDDAAATRREADMRELRSRPGPALSAMERDVLPPRGRPRDDYGHAAAPPAQNERELRDRRPPPSGGSAPGGGGGGGGGAGGLRDSNWSHDRMSGPDRGQPRDSRNDGGYRGGRGDQGHGRRDGGPMMDGRGGPAGGNMEDGGSGRKRGRGMTDDGYGEQKRPRR